MTELETLNAKLEVAEEDVARISSNYATRCEITENLEAEIKEWIEWKVDIDKLLADNKKTFKRVLAENKWMSKYVEQTEGSLWRDRMKEELGVAV